LPRFGWQLLSTSLTPQKQQLNTSLENEDATALDPLLTGARDHLLRWRDLQKYARIDPDNPRLRALLRETVETRNCSG
jgi:hypothetical protein